MSRAVVLLHGLAGSPRVWDRVLPLLDPGPVLAPVLDQPRSIEADADVIAATLTGDGLTDVVVVGHSRGGLVATAMAERHPRLVGRLVLVNTPPTVASRLTARAGGERLLALPVLGCLVWSRLPRAAAAGGLATAFAPGTPVPDVFVDDMLATSHRTFRTATTSIDDYLAERPLLARLADLDLPVDLVLGQLDRRVDLSAYDQLVARAERSLVAAAGHTPPWEDPEAVAAVVRRAAGATP